MDQEVFNTLSQTSFASWSLGRYTVVMSRSWTRPFNLANLRAGKFWKIWPAVLFYTVFASGGRSVLPPAFPHNSPPTRQTAVVYPSLRTEWNLSIPNVLITVLVRPRCLPICLLAVPLSPSTIFVGSCNWLCDFVSCLERVS